MEQTTKRKDLHILIASSTGAIFSAILLNPLDVIKVRQMNSIDCKPTSSPSAPLCNSKMGFFQYMNMSRSTKMICDCLSQNKIILPIVQVVTKEGWLTLTNGIFYSLSQYVVQQFIFLLAYERTKFFLSQHINDPIAVPVISSVVGRIIGTTFSFPFEYWKTIQMNQVGISKKNGFALGNKLYTSYFITIKRDIIFSSIFWPLNEQINRYLKGNRKKSEKGNLSNMSINIFSAGFSGAIASLITQPFDYVKTTSQINSTEPGFENKGFFKKSREVIEKEGFLKLYTGLKVRTTKISMACAIAIGIYESIMNFFEASNKI